MAVSEKGRRPRLSAVTRALIPTFGLVSVLALGACTTTEGTNALTDVTTFEREVMTSTLEGMGIIDRVEKEETTDRRGPLVLPKGGTPLPQPGEEDIRVAALPEDSDKVQIDASSLSEEDLKRLRNAKVVDLRTLSGRPLTDAEARKLTARMTAARLASGPRPLYLPPDEYFTTIEGTDLVCMSKSGELVPVDSKDCPFEIKAALGRTNRATSGGVLGGDPNRDLSGEVGQ
jgi:hypothetical protein